jgi:predicted nucleic acid-binding protein
MSNFFVDANVIIDLLMDRKPFSQQSADLFENALSGKVGIFASALSFSNIYYIIRKSIGHKEAIVRLEKLSEFCIILDVTQAIIKASIASGHSDFEDSIQYHTALSNPVVEAIVTRDRSGFNMSQLPVFSPEEALTAIL